MNGLRLSHIALAVRDRETVARAFERDFQLVRADIGGVPFLGIGETALALFEAGDPVLGGSGRTGVNHLTFVTDDAPALGEKGLGLAGATEWRLDPADTADIATRFTTPLDLPASASPHVSRIDHIGIASRDIAGDEAVFAGRYSCPVESRQTDVESLIPVESFTSDRHGVVYHTRPPVVVGGLRAIFITVGDCELECMSDLNPEHVAEIRRGSPGTTKQDRSAIATYVERYGPGLHHIAFCTDDIDGNLGRLAGKGYRTIDRQGRPGGRRSRIGFLHPAALGGVLTHFVQHP